MFHALLFAKEEQEQKNGSIKELELRHFCQGGNRGSIHHAFTDHCSLLSDVFLILALGLAVKSVNHSFLAQ